MILRCHTLKGERCSLTYVQHAGTSAHLLCLAYKGCSGAALRGRTTDAAGACKSCRRVGWLVEKRNRVG